MQNGSLRNTIVQEDCVRQLRIGLPLLVFLGSLTVSNSAIANLQGALTVDVNGVRDQRGQLCIKLFRGSRGFPNGDESAIRRQCVKITENPVRFTYRGLAAGSYAVAVFHDANGDGKLNRNAAGMPTEGFGFSNNPVVRQSAPRFGQAVFLVAGPNTRASIQMQYGI